MVGKTKKYSYQISLFANGIFNANDIDEARKYIEENKQEILLELLQDISNIELDELFEMV